MDVDVEAVVLQPGVHARPEDGLKVLELASLLAGQPFSSHPHGVSPVLAVLLLGWNDGLGDRERQQLKPYARHVLGTAASPATERRRVVLANYATIRATSTPKSADELRTLRRWAGLEEDETKE